MPIKKTLAPVKSTKLFKEWVSKHQSGGSLTHSYSYEETLPHKIFHASLSDIVSGKGFENAQIVAWRHLHTESKGNHALVEIKVGQREDEHFFQEVHYGPLTIQYKSLFAKLKKIEKLENEDFELSYLRLFALRISAIWLRARERNNDIFIPFAPCFYGLRAGELYSSQEFLKITQDAAHRFLMRFAELNEADLKGG